MSRQPIVYLAGFDVFRPDATQHGRYLVDLCLTHGLQGIFPTDTVIAPQNTPQDTARVICQNNIKLIHQCDAVLANLNVFRGFEPDSGTAFEVGMAVALNKPVWAYFAAVDSLLDLVPHDTQKQDAQGYIVEDFQLPRNLMLACSWAGHSASVEDAVPALAAHLKSL